VYGLDDPLIVGFRDHGVTSSLRSVWQNVISELCLAPVPLAGFQIPVSEAARFQQTHLPPDHFACDECLGEMNDSQDRRFRYPFSIAPSAAHATL
jgi:hypothetical protein